MKDEVRMKNDERIKDGEGLKIEPKHTTNACKLINFPISVGRALSLL